MTNDFDDVRALRPSPPPPTESAIHRSRKELMSAIDSEARSTTARQRSRPAAPRVRFLRPLAAVGSAAAVFLGLFALGDRAGGPAWLDAEASAATVFAGAVDRASVTPASTPTGQIRHLRFRNLTDPGHPVYDVYIRPDGTAMVGPANRPEALEPTDGFVTAGEIDSLPTDSAAMRRRLLAMAEQLGYDPPGERPERGLYRVATDLLPDPGLTHEARAAIYRVLEGLDLRAIRARNLGPSIDADGRPVITLEFAFQEGAVDRMTIDQRDASLVSVTTRLADGELLGGQVYLVADTLTAIPR